MQPSAGPWYYVVSNRTCSVPDCTRPCIAINKDAENGRRCAEHLTVLIRHVCDRNAEIFFRAGQEVQAAPIIVPETPPPAAKRETLSQAEVDKLLAGL